MAVLYGNAAQVIFALLGSLILLVSATPHPTINNGSFENNNLSMWTLTTNSTTFVCSNSAGSLCARVNLGNAPRGVHGLQISVPDLGMQPSVAVLSQVSTDDPSRYRGEKIMFSVFVKDAGGPSKRYQLQVFDGTSTLTSDSYSVGSTFLDSGNMVVTPGPTAVNLTYQLVLTGAGTYQIDDIAVLTSPDIFPGLVMSIAGLWWFGFGFYVFRNIRSRPASRQPEPGQSPMMASAKQLWKTFKSATSHNKNLFIFLLSYMMYSNGSGALIALIGSYLSDRLLMSGTLTGVVILWAQLIGIAGAFVFYAFGKKYGLKLAFNATLVLWVITGLLSYFLLVDENDQMVAFIIAIPIGLGLGAGIGISRALFAGMIPKGLEAEYFGLYQLSNKITSWAGTLLFTIVNEVTNDMRAALLSTFAWHVVSFFLMLFVHYVPEKHDGGPVEISGNSPHGSANGSMNSEGKLNATASTKHPSDSDIEIPPASPAVRDPSIPSPELPTLSLSGDHLAPPSIALDPRRGSNGSNDGQHVVRFHLEMPQVDQHGRRGSANPFLQAPPAGAGPSENPFLPNIQSQQQGSSGNNA